MRRAEDRPVPTASPRPEDDDETRVSTQAEAQLACLSDLEANLASRARAAPRPLTTAALVEEAEEEFEAAEEAEREDAGWGDGMRTSSGWGGGGAVELARVSARGGFAI